MNWEKSLHCVGNSDNSSGPAQITLRHRTEKNKKGFLRCHVLGLPDRRGEHKVISKFLSKNCITTWECFLYFRRRIEPWEFEMFFDPRDLRKEACLLYEIKWGTSHKIWRNSSKNTTKHVELNFIEKFTSERRFCSSISCSIIWFLSWSPCWECSKAIREFLSQRPGVTLVIYVARLYWHMDQQNRQGLRDLINCGVTIQIMRPSGENKTKNLKYL